MNKHPKLNPNKAGLVFGIFLAVVHLIWSILVALIPNQLQTFFDWVLKLHSISMPFTIKPFVFMNAFWLVIVTFVVGFILGWLLVVILNCVCQKCKKKRRR